MRIISIKEKLLPFKITELFSLVSYKRGFFYISQPMYQIINKNNTNKNTKMSKRELALKNLTQVLSKSIFLTKIGLLTLLTYFCSLFNFCEASGGKLTSLVMNDVAIKQHYYKLWRFRAMFRKCCAKYNYNFQQFELTQHNLRCVVKGKAPNPGNQTFFGHF